MEAFSPSKKHSKALKLKINKISKLKLIMINQTIKNEVKID